MIASAAATTAAARRRRHRRYPAARTSFDVAFVALVVVGASFAQIALPFSSMSSSSSSSYNAVVGGHSWHGYGGGGSSYSNRNHNNNNNNNPSASSQQQQQQQQRRNNNNNARQKPLIVQQLSSSSSSDATTSTTTKDDVLTSPFRTSATRPGSDPTNGGGAPDSSSDAVVVSQRGAGEQQEKEEQDGSSPSPSLLSKLLFSYASPLLDAASRRRLDVDDALDVVPERRRMDASVTSLGRIRRHVAWDEAKKRVEERRKRRRRKNDDGGDALDDGGDGTAAAATSESFLLAKSLLLHQRRALAYTGLLRIINTTIQAFPALLVSRLLKLVEAGDAQPPAKALAAALTLVLVLTTKMIVENQFFHHVVQMSTEVRGALAGMIFDKSLRLPGGGSGVARAPSESSPGGGTDEGTLGAGGVLNLMQSDTGIIESAALQLHTIWDGPLQIAIYTTLLFRYLGPPVFWGIGVLLLTIPVNSVTLRLLNRLSRFENEAKDARTKRTAESISNMKLLKLQGWEEQFANDIRASRRDELRRHVSRGVVRALNTAFSNAVPALVLVVTLTAYVRTGKPLVASTIFTAISLFNQLRFPLFFYPMLVDSLANGKNAMRRIASYLSSEEVVPYVRHLPAPNTGGGSIEMKNGNFLWSTAPKNATTPDSSSTAPALIDAEVKVKGGEIVAVVGGVGSGKSALIKALLGELNPAPRAIVNQAVSPSSSSLLDDEVDAVNQSPGFENIETSQIVSDKPSVTTFGNVAYCSQESWLPKGPIRDAIVFGREFNEDRYNEAIRDAGLDQDIVSVDQVNRYGGSSAPAEGRLSHDTDVGEGGSALSGGQRARVALARALYASDDTKVFLLDDCLAALDASVGSIVFDRLSRRLRRLNCAVVLVTNDPSIPRQCDRVILMGKVPSTASCSKIIDVGRYDDLIARGHDLRRSVSVSVDGMDTEDHDSDGKEAAMYASHEQELQNTVEAKKLTKVSKKSIRVVGGYEAPMNCSEASCHADPECQVGMTNCPDYMADQVVPVSPDISESDTILHDLPVIANLTDLPSIEAQALVERTASFVSSEQAVRSEPIAELPAKLSSADEAMSTGAVPWSTYVSYFKAVRRPLLIAAMLCSYLMANGAQFFQQYTIAKWTEVGHGTAMAAALGAKYMRSLVNAALVVSVFLWLRSFLTMSVGVRASEFLHSRMLSSVFAAPMSFFDATPSGQLLSRFGKEIESVDRMVPDSFGAVLFCFLQIFMSIGALMGVVTPGMLIPIAIVGVLYVKTMAKFRPAARDMKRAETKSRSPIYTHFGEALRGSETIRSIPGASHRWSQRHRYLSDINLAVFYTVKSFDRWLAARLETLGNTVVFTAAIASVFLTRMNRLKAGAAGWGLTQSLAITGMLTWAVRCLTDLETNMMSVMRVKELTDLESEEPNLNAIRKMPKEPSDASESLAGLFSSGISHNTSLAPVDNTVLVRDGWPWRGNVQFRNVSMRYNPTSPLVLDGVTMSVPAGTTLGVVGRTGSWNSYLLLLLSSQTLVHTLNLLPFLSYIFAVMVPRIGKELAPPDIVPPC